MEANKEFTDAENHLLSKNQFYQVWKAITPAEKETITAWWQALVDYVGQKSATDIHFTQSGGQGEIKLRINTMLADYAKLDSDIYLKTLLYYTTPRQQMEIASPAGASDFAVTISGRRLRVNQFRAIEDSLEGVYRPLPSKAIEWQKNKLSARVIDKIREAKQGLILVTGPTGSGKCLGQNTPVLMFDGTIKKVQDIKTGDLLMGPDSTPREVKSVTQDFGRCYEIIPKKGESWICNANHVMTLKRSVNGITSKRGEQRRSEGNQQAFGKTKPKGGTDRTMPVEIIDVPLEDFIGRTPEKKKIDQHWKLFRTGVEFPPSPINQFLKPDHFYYVGLWIGDGTNSVNKITTKDQGIRKWFKRFSQENGYNYLTKPIKGKENLTLESATSQRRYANPINPEVQFLAMEEGRTKIDINRLLEECVPQIKGINKKKEKTVRNPKEKCIPQWMLTAQRSQRLALLAGILDTDGTLEGNCFELTLTSELLIQQILFLARSLGMAAHYREPKFVEGEPYPRIRIYGEINEIPTQLERKKAQPKRQIKDALGTGWSFVPAQNQNYYGFELDGDGRFLLGDFTVTHNSSTICSMIEYLNEKFPYNIITIEDPVEYIFSRKKALIRQREIGDSTDSFNTALRHSLRQNPDIIFIGEIRDYETAKIALQAADTGHLVFATLHTRRVYSTISRLLEMAPAESQNEMRSVLSNSLLMVMCQRLLKKRTGGLVPAREIMISNVAVASLIKSGKEKSISSVLITKQTEGMMEWQKALDILVEQGEVDRDEAKKYEDETEKMS